MTNPFINSVTGYGATSAQDRLDMVKRFSRKQLEQALEVPHLQKDVVKRIRSRLKQLESQQ